jgi:hypothetical protein
MNTSEMTFLYLRPGVIESVIDAVEVDEALALLTLILGLPPDGELRTPGSLSVTITDIPPEVVWRTLERLLPQSRLHDLFLVPGTCQRT